MRFHVPHQRSFLRADGLELAELGKDIRLDPVRRKAQFPPAEPVPVMVPRVGPDCHTPLQRLTNRDAHQPGAPGVEAARDAHRGDYREQAQIGFTALGEVGVQVHG